MKTTRRGLLAMVVAAPVAKAVKAAKPVTTIIPVHMGGEGFGALKLNISPELLGSYSKDYEFSLTRLAVEESAARMKRDWIERQNHINFKCAEREIEEGEQDGEG